MQINFILSQRLNRSTRRWLRPGASRSLEPALLQVDQTLHLKSIRRMPSFQRHSEDFFHSSTQLPTTLPTSVDRDLFTEQGSSNSAAEPECPRLKNSMNTSRAEPLQASRAEPLQASRAEPLQAWATSQEKSHSHNDINMQATQQESLLSSYQSIAPAPYLDNLKRPSEATP